MHTYNGASSHTLDGELEIFLLLRRHFTNGSVILRFVSFYLICGSKMFLFSSLKGCCGLAHAAIRVWPQFVGATALPLERNIRLLARNVFRTLYIHPLVHPIHLLDELLKVFHLSSTSLINLWSLSLIQSHCHCYWSWSTAAVGYTTNLVRKWALISFKGIIKMCSAASDSSSPADQ